MRLHIVDETDGDYIIDVIKLDQYDLNEEEDVRQVLDIILDIINQQDSEE
jgi:hypothetical protein